MKHTECVAATCLKEALDKVFDFLEKTTGRTASPQEVADALTRYFVLNEIKAHVEKARSTTEKS